MPNNTTHINPIARLLFATVLTTLIHTTTHARIDQVVKDLQPAPDGNGIFRVISTDEDPAINNAGQFSFLGQFSDNDIDPLASNRIIRVETDGSLTQIANRGDTAPDGIFKYQSFSTVTYIADNGQVLFATDLGFAPGMSNKNAILRSDGLTDTEIAREDDPAPDAAGFFNGPITNNIDQNNHVGFTDLLSPTPGGSIDSEGIFLTTPTTSHKLARTSEPAPDATGTPDGTMTGFLNPIFNNNSQATFFSHLSGTSGAGTFREQGIFLADTTGITQIARPGIPVPAKPSDDPLKITGINAFPQINDNGHVTFEADLSPTGLAGISTAEGLYKHNGTELVQIARHGHAVPGHPGRIITSFAPHFPTINNNSEVLFQASTGPNIFSSDKLGLFLGTDHDNLKLLALSGQPVPDGNGTFASFRNQQPFSNHDPPGVNNAGQTAFYSLIDATTGGSDDNVGLFLTDGIETIQAIRKGQPLGGGTAKFFRAQLNNPRITGLSFNDHGQVAFKAQLTDNSWGYFLFTPDLHWRATAADNQWDSNANWTISTNPAHVHDLYIDPDTESTITGPGPSAGGDTIRSLTLGSPAAPATLLLDNAGNLTTTHHFNLEPNATINIQAATLTVHGPANLQGTTQIDGQATFNAHTTGPAHLSGTGQVTFNSTYAPGASPAVVNITTNTTFSPTATLQLDVLNTTTPLPGTTHDQLNITGPLTLNGTLDINPLPDLGPITDTPLGTEFNALTYTSRTGMFTTANTLIDTTFALAPLFKDTDADPDALDDTLFLRASIPGDLNLDNKVSVADLSEFALNFGTTPGLYNEALALNSWQLGDFNTDGQITVADLSLLALNFGFDAADPTSTPTPLSLTDAATLAGIDPSTIPEPATAALIFTTAAITLSARPKIRHLNGPHKTTQ